MCIDTFLVMLLLMVAQLSRPILLSQDTRIFTINLRYGDAADILQGWGKKVKGSGGVVVV